MKNQSNVCPECQFEIDSAHPYHQPLCSMNHSNQDTSLSKCCGVPYALSVSTKWGRRVLCSHCGKPRDNKVDTSLSAIRAAGPTAAAQTTEDMKRYDSKETLIEDAVKEIESKITDHVFDGSCCYNDNEGGKGHAECRYPYNPGRENPSEKQCLKLKSEHKDLRQTFSDLYDKAHAAGREEAETVSPEIRSYLENKGAQVMRERILAAMRKEKSHGEWDDTIDFIESII